MRTPSIKDLPEPWREAALTVARVLGERGFRAWLVGGAVRDLALGRTPKDADLCSAATPDEVEALFPRTHAVGRAFGTVLVHQGDVDLELTTFRSDGAYRDGRRPESVSWGASVEEDAARRDFTANALYLDPLTDELADPTGGLADVAAGRLRCVGEPAERFAEDGLRILRMARFAARYGWEVEPATLRAATASLGALRGVSVERVLAELVGIADSRRPGQALALLAETGALALVLPAVEADLEARCRAVEHLGDAPGAVRLLATLLQPADPTGLPRALEAAQNLRVSRATAGALERTWTLAFDLLDALASARGAELARARLLRLVRTPQLADAVAVLRAHERVEPPDRERLAAWERLPAELGHNALHPASLLTGADLAAAGLPAGPAYADILREAEDHCLEGTHATRDDALEWLAERVRAVP